MGAVPSHDLLQRTFPNVSLMFFLLSFTWQATETQSSYTTISKKCHIKTLVSNAYSFMPQSQLHLGGKRRGKSTLKGQWSGCSISNVQISKLLLHSIPSSLLPQFASFLWHFWTAQTVKRNSCYCFSGFPLKFSCIIFGLQLSLEISYFF